MNSNERNFEVERLVSMLGELQGELALLVETAQVRELRFLARRYETALLSMRAVPPCNDQQSAMRDCLDELERRVRRERPSVPPQVFEESA